MSLQERAVGVVLHHRFDQVDLVHRDELQDLGSRLAGSIARQCVHHLDMFRRLDALGRGKIAAQLLLQRGLIGFDEGIEPDADACGRRTRRSRYRGPAGSSGSGRSARARR